MYHGREYIIVTTGTTNFVTYGAASNTVGERFIFNSVSPFVGNGTVQIVGFEVSHSSVNGLLQLEGVIHNEDEGLRIFNPELISGGNVITGLNLKTSTGFTNLGSGASLGTITIKAIGGGGGGGFGRDNNTATGSAGTGGTTTVKLRNGSTTGTQIGSDVVASGGAGGLRTNDPGVPSPIRISDPVSLSPGPYTITIGDGGNSGPDTPQANRIGDNSSIGSLVVASGGGGGGPASPDSTMDGGSGGGQQGSGAGDSIASPDGLTPTVQGSAGGTRDGGGGGGGASQTDAPRQTSPPYQPSSGAAGLNCPGFSSPIIHPNCPMPSEWQTYVGSNGMYAQGGWGYPNRDSSWNNGSPSYAGCLLYTSPSPRDRG